jgi:hypothetical protein
MFVPTRSVPTAALPRHLDPDILARRAARLARDGDPHSETPTRTGNTAIFRRGSESV